MMTNGKSKRPFSHCYGTPFWVNEPIAACIPYKKLPIYCTKSGGENENFYNTFKHLCMRQKPDLACAKNPSWDKKYEILFFNLYLKKLISVFSENFNMFSFHFIHIFHFEITGKSIYHNFLKICSQISYILIKVKAFYCGKILYTLPENYF